MSIPNSPVFSSEDITRFYSEHLDAHGDSSRGVGWKNDEAQNIRFQQLAKVIESKSRFSINDLGCGTGKLFDYMLSMDLTPVMYRGYDILDEMVRVAKQRLSHDIRVEVSRITSAAEMQPGDYTVASGIFNVKYEALEYEWMNYVLATLQSMNVNSGKGFAFNLLTKYSDKEFMQSYLYYADPLFYFDYCKRNFAKNVALLHDYGQYDFTIIVRK